MVISLPQYDIGENWLVQRKFYAADGTTPVPLEDIKLVKCTIIQSEAEKFSFTYTPDDGFSDGMSNPSSSIFRIEVSQAHSLTLRSGDVYALWQIGVTNFDFPLDDNTQKDFFKELVCKMR